MIVFIREGLPDAGKYSNHLFVAAVCGLLIGVERREKMQVTELAAGLTDGKGDLVRLYDWLAQRKITVREIDLKRKEGNSVKIVLYIAMLRHFDKADFLRLQEDIPGVQSVEI